MSLEDEQGTVSWEDYGYGDSGYGFNSDDFLSTPGYGVTDDVDYSNLYDWNIGEDGSRQKLNRDGSFSYQDPDGSTYSIKDNVYTTQSEGKTWRYDADQKGFIDAAGKLIKDAPTGLLSKFVNAVKANPFAALGTAYAASKLGKGSGDSGGYSRPVPKMNVVAERPQYDDTNRQPGEAGRRYFTTPLFVAEGDAANTQKAIEATLRQKAGLEAAAPKYAPPAANPYVGKIPTAFNNVAAPAPAQTAGLPAVMTPEEYAKRGGIRMAEGGIADAGRYLRGKTDGMADEIETSIDEEQPALLSHGEFVVPADVVSHLGNGNSEAGAEKLYEMMDRVRMARTGTKEQGKEIDPDKFLAAAGGLAAAYSGGGAVQSFADGGVPLDTSKTSTLSPWVGDYVTDALGRGAALANAPYQPYQGRLTAGASNLQQQAFAGASDLASAGYTPGSFMGGFGSAQASQYMNPYLQASLDPQLKELQRQSDIQRVNDAGRLTAAGAYGGGRQAIMESEGRRNLLDKQADLLGTGYKTAYDTGLGQFNKEREAGEASRQFSANYGLKTIDQLANLGETERGITSEGLAADKKAFEDEREWAYKMPQYQLGLLSGLPIGANTTSVNQDDLSKLQSDVSGLASLYETLANLGVKKTDTTTTKR
jgi:hypothetical protein